MAFPDTEPKITCVEGEDWKKVKLERVSNGRKIYSYLCFYCKEIFNNHKNVRSHVIECKRVHLESEAQKNVPEDQRLITEFVTIEEIKDILKKHEEKENEEKKPKKEHYNETTMRLIELIADMNIPYTQLEKPAWRNFVSSLDPRYKIPSTQQLHQLIIDYAKYTEERTLQELSGKVCGLCIDGTTYYSEHYYSLILVAERIVRLLRIVNVADQTAITLSHYVAEAWEEAVKHGIKISGVCTDNAANISAAISKEEHLGALIGQAVYRLACCCHTGQLSVNDFFKHNKEVQNEVNKLLNLMKWIDERDDSFRNYVYIKKPEFVKTRWNTLCEVISFCLDNQIVIEEFIRHHQGMEQEDYEDALANPRKKSFIKPIKAPIEKIPSFFKELFPALSIIRDFTLKTEGDLVFQQDLFVAYNNAIQQFDELPENQYVKAVKTFFVQRFAETANISLAELSYILTPDGLNDYREKIGTNSETHFSKMPEFKALLKTVALTVTTECKYKSECVDQAFEYYVSLGELPSCLSLYDSWKQYGSQSVILPNKKRISNRLFAEIAIPLTSMPCSESINERCFSSLKKIVSKFNKQMEPKTFVAIATVKMATRFLRKYPQEP